MNIAHARPGRVKISAPYADQQQDISTTRNTALRLLAQRIANHLEECHSLREPEQNFAGDSNTRYSKIRARQGFISHIDLYRARKYATRAGEIKQ